jgi:general secretion pathway protein F
MARLVATLDAGVGAGAPDGLAARARALVERLATARARLGRRQTERFLDMLADLLDAGLGLLEALGTIAEATADPATRRAAEGLARRLERGATLGEAMREEGFAPVVTAGVHAGEWSGHVPAVLRELAAGLRRDLDTLARVRAALAYPVTVLVILIGVFGLFVFYALPRLSDLLPGGTRPLAARLLLGLADRALAWWPLALVAAASGGAALLWLRTSDWTLGLPVVGPVLRATVMARFWGHLGVLARAGVHLTDALGVAGSASGNPAAQALAGRAVTRLRQGSTLADAVGAEPLVSRLAAQLVAIGEASGALDRQCDRLHRLHQAEFEQTVRRLTGLLGPAMLVLVAGLILVFFFGFLLPIYEGLGAAG